MNAKQKQYLKTFKANFCDISKTMAEFSLSKRQYLTWVNDEDFAEALWDAREAMRDGVEAQIYQQILKHEDTSVLNKFGLSILRERDYYEKKEVELNAEHNNYITLYDGEGDEFEVNTTKHKGH